MKCSSFFFQCWIKDGSRPAAYIMQLRYANHLMLLWSKAMVVSDKEKGSLKSSGKCK